MQKCSCTHVYYHSSLTKATEYCFLFSSCVFIWNMHEVKAKLKYKNDLFFNIYLTLRERATLFAHLNVISIWLLRFNSNISVKHFLGCLMVVIRDPTVTHSDGISQSSKHTFRTLRTANPPWEWCTRQENAKRSFISCLISSGMMFRR